MVAPTNGNCLITRPRFLGLQQEFNRGDSRRYGCLPELFVMYGWMLYDTPSTTRPTVCNGPIRIPGTRIWRQDGKGSHDRPRPPLPTPRANPAPRKPAYTAAGAQIPWGNQMNYVRIALGCVIHFAVLVASVALIVAMVKHGLCNV